MTIKQKETIRGMRIRGANYAQISAVTGLNLETIKSHCRRNGLTPTDIKKMNDENRCRECGAPITQLPKRKKRIFCCKSCREKWWAVHSGAINKKAIYEFTCAGCGKAFTAYGNKHRKYCCHECYIRHRFGEAR